MSLSYTDSLKRGRGVGARALLSGLVSLALLLTACGGGAQPAATTAPAAKPTEAAKPAAAATTAPAAAAKPTEAPAAAAKPAANASPAAAAPAPTTAAGGAAAANLSGTAKIGFVFSMTGAAAQYGITQKNGVQLAIDEINSSGALGSAKIEPVFEDDQSEKAPGINVFQKLINQDRVVAIEGPTLSNTAQATDPISQQAGVPTLGVSNTAGGITEIGDFIWRDSLTEAQVIPQTVKAVKDKGNVKRGALLYGQDDAFTKAGYDVFKQAMQANGIEIVSEQTFAKGDKDFSAQLTTIKNANPDAIFTSALIDEATGIVTQAQRLGIKALIVGGNGFNSPALMKNAGDAAEGVIVGAAWNSASSNPKSQDFIKAYKAKYNSDPDQFAAQAHAGVYILAEALKSAKSTTDRKAVRDGFGQVKNLPTVLGSFNFTKDRDADHPAVVQVVKGGQFAVYQ